MKRLEFIRRMAVGVAAGPVLVEAMALRGRERRFFIASMGEHGDVTWTEGRELPEGRIQIGHVEVEVGP